MNMSFDREMDAIISQSKQIFITMPAKAAGTSLKSFTQQCMKRDVVDNLINRKSLSEALLTDEFEVPSIITSHLYKDKPLINLARHSTRDSLIIYIHRDETDRVLSGIKHVLRSRVCGTLGGVSGLSSFHIEKNGTHCIIDEDEVVKRIQDKEHEIGLGLSEILTCDTYEEIEENAPNMLFVHYKQVDQLEKLLAKHHCPELLEEPSLEKDTTTGSEEQTEVYLRLKRGGGRMERLEDWLDAKRGVLEWSLRLRKEGSCQAITKHLENDLFENLLIKGLLAVRLNTKISSQFHCFQKCSVGPFK